MSNIKYTPTGEYFGALVDAYTEVYHRYVGDYKGNIEALNTLTKLLRDEFVIQREETILKECKEKPKEKRYLEEGVIEGFVEYTWRGLHMDIESHAQTKHEQRSEQVNV